MSIPYCFCMHKHTWWFHLYQQFSLLIKMQPNWHGSTFSLQMTLCCQGYMAPVVVVVVHDFTKKWRKHFIFCGFWVLSRLQQLCCQECINARLSRAVMGIHGNVNSSDWMEEWMDSILVCPRQCRERERERERERRERSRKRKRERERECVCVCVCVCECKCEIEGHVLGSSWTQS